jgi:hypothetical protein
MTESARAAWEVTAGLVPGQAMDEYTRRWVLTATEWWETDGMVPSLQGVALFNAHATAAMEYARGLMDPRQLNWVKVEWIWF